jgi:hypothetical protein
MLVSTTGQSTLLCTGHALSGWQSWSSWTYRRKIQCSRPRQDQGFVLPMGIIRTRRVTWSIFTGGLNKIFMWFLFKKVLVKTTFQRETEMGTQKCVLWFSRNNWPLLYFMLICSSQLKVVYFTYNISPWTNVTNMFKNWLNKIERKQKFESLPEFVF